MTDKKAIAWYRYTMRLVKVECPKCGDEMYSVEVEIWMCGECDFVVHDDELEWKVQPKEK